MEFHAHNVPGQRYIVSSVSGYPRSRSRVEGPDFCHQARLDQISNQARNVLDASTFLVQCGYIFTWNIVHLNCGI